MEKGSIVFPSSSDTVYSVSYVPQVAWLQSVSIRYSRSDFGTDGRENILFGLEFDEERYLEVLEVSQRQYASNLIVRPPALQLICANWRTAIDRDR